MVCCDLLFYWFRFEYRAIKQHQNELKRQKSAVIEIEPDQDQCDSCDPKSQVKSYNIAIENRLMCVWALIEMSVLTIVLFLKTEDGYPSNFYNDVYLVGNNDNGVINKMIAVRLLTGFLFFLGAKMEVVAFKIPWFIVTISGYAPFWQIVTSSFINYDKLRLNNSHSDFDKISIILRNLAGAINNTLPNFY